ncbi:MAG: aminodeoxychorismate/anthranilate synthase component II [Clostridiales bacterium]|jgi:anthranilate synthase component 2|nr:aminodeoxychorismate/anthranilate synthase component II [Clostridiales bacterium]
MILIIDNYDSFTYNLVQYVGIINKGIAVKRNNEISVQDISTMMPSHIILSSGSGSPKESSICGDIIKKFREDIPILGIGLGHLAICEAFGGITSPARQIMHGKQSNIHLANGSKIFNGLAPMEYVARYHSLITCKEELPDELLVIAEDDDGEVMAIKHRNHDIYGLQFNPESILTPRGDVMIKNFLEIGGDDHDSRSN